MSGIDYNGYYLGKCCSPQQMNLNQKSLFRLFLISESFLGLLYVHRWSHGLSNMGLYSFPCDEYIKTLKVFYNLRHWALTLVKLRLSVWLLCLGNSMQSLWKITYLQYRHSWLVNAYQKCQNVFCLALLFALITVLIMYLKRTYRAVSACWIYRELMQI